MLVRKKRAETDRMPTENTERTKSPSRKVDYPLGCFFARGRHLHGDLFIEARRRADDDGDDGGVRNNGAAWRQEAMKHLSIPCNVDDFN
jgi:hypothetical protein